MAKRRATRNSEAFDLKLSKAERDQLADQLCVEIQDALDARATIIADGGLIDFWDWFYEQGRTAPNQLPFPGAADLTSYIITENVDAMQSQLMRAVYGVTPICFVSGWGESAKKAQYVEAFMDWQARKSGLKEELDKTLFGALIEDCYILEVREQIETRRHVEEFDAAIQTNPEGGAIFDAQGNVQVLTDGEGEPIKAEMNQPAARIKRSYVRTKRLGPRYEPISMKDFVFLPGHARTKHQIWGYAYRFWERIPTIQERADDGIYDKDALKEMGDGSDRETEAVIRVVDSVAPQQGPAVEKELWQLSLKRDLDGDGREEWYLATVSVKHRVLLRLKLDTFVMKVGRPRCVPFVLFPRRNAVYGYSYAGDKLSTLAEEHTALRNMKADRGALATNKPLKVMRGAPWNPDTQPIGVGRTITVNRQDDIQELDIADVPAGIVEQERSIIQAKERVGMLSDATIGVLADEKRTLGENRLVQGGSGTRVSTVIGRLHDALAAVFELTHAIWLETLEADPKGVEAPQRVIDQLSSQKMDLKGGRFTLENLKGEFAFEPYGSIDTANPERQRGDFNNWLTALTNLAKVFPAMQAIFMSPDAAKAILEEGMRVYQVRDREPFLGAFRQLGALPPAMGPGMSPGPEQMPGDPMAGGNPMAMLEAMMGGGQPPEVEGMNGGY